MSLFKKIRSFWQPEPAVSAARAQKPKKPAAPPRFTPVPASAAPRIPAEIELAGACAPIAVFCYRRPEHLQRTLAGLRANALAAQSDLFIFCDGARSEEDRAAVAATRAVARAQPWCGRVQVVEGTRNCGLSTSITAGVTQLCARFGRVIVLEDDLVPAPAFLEYMNGALTRYADEPAVQQISGFMFPVGLAGERPPLFMPLTTSWGWATWQRAWRNFSNDATRVDLAALDNAAVRARFDLDDHYPFFKMLRGRLKGSNDSWAVLWRLTVFLQNGLVLYPPQTLIENIGFDGSGVHSGRREQPEAVELWRGAGMWPAEIREDEETFTKVKQWLRAGILAAQAAPPPDQAGA